MIRDLNVSKRCHDFMSKKNGIIIVMGGMNFKLRIQKAILSLPGIRNLAREYAAKEPRRRASPVELSMATVLL